MRATVPLVHRGAALRLLPVTALLFGSLSPRHCLAAVPQRSQRRSEVRINTPCYRLLLHRYCYRCHRRQRRLPALLLAAGGRLQR